MDTVLVGEFYCVFLYLKSCTIPWSHLWPPAMKDECFGESVDRLIFFESSRFVSVWVEESMEDELFRVQTRAGNSRWKD